MVSNEFLSEIEIDITTGGHILIFTVYKNGHFKNSRLTFLHRKGWNVGFLSEITPRPLTFRGRIADVT